MGRKFAVRGGLVAGQLQADQGGAMEGGLRARHAPRAGRRTVVPPLVHFSGTVKGPIFRASQSNNGVVGCRKFVHPARNTSPASIRSHDTQRLSQAPASRGESGPVRAQPDRTGRVPQRRRHRERVATPTAVDPSSPSRAGVREGIL